MSQHIHRTITLILTERWTITWLSDDQMAAAHADSTLDRELDREEVSIIVEYTQSVVCEIVAYIQTESNFRIR